MIPRISVVLHALVAALLKVAADSIGLAGEMVSSDVMVRRWSAVSLGSIMAKSERVSVSQFRGRSVVRAAMISG